MEGYVRAFGTGASFYIDVYRRCYACTAEGLEVGFFGIAKITDELIHHTYALAAQACA